MNIELKSWHKLSDQMRGEFNRLPVAVLQELHEALRLRLLMHAANKLAQNQEKASTCNALLRATAEALADHESY